MKSDGTVKIIGSNPQSLKIQFSQLAPSYYFQLPLVNAFGLQKVLSKNKVYLHFKKITGMGDIPIIKVYLHSPRGHHNQFETFLGSLGLYGLEQSSKYINDEIEIGMHLSLDISKALEPLRHYKYWNDDGLRFSLQISDPIKDPVQLEIESVYLICGN